MNLTQCPLCQADIEIGPKPSLGQEVVCPHCDAQLEVVWLYPLALDEPEEADLTQPFLTSSEGESQEVSL